MIPMKVSAPYHSELMLQFHNKMEALVNKISIQKPSVSILSTVTEEYIQNANTVRSNLISQMTRPILWNQVIKKLMDTNEYEFMDIGPNTINMNLLQEDYKDKKVLGYDKKKRDLDILKDSGIQLALFPEMSFTGFSMNTSSTKEENMESIRLVQEWTQEYQMAIGCGWVKGSGDKCENHYTLINHGVIIADYVKIHPFSYSGEDKYFTKRNKLSICNVDNFVVGLQICYDLRFPEVFQILSKKASIIIVPSNWPKIRREHWNCLLKARAIENQVYLSGINCVGTIAS